MDVILGPFNTIDVPAGTVLRLKGDQGLNRPMDLINLGPGVIYIREDLDPSVGDTHSLKLPAGWALNDTVTDGRIGLGVFSAEGATIAVRVT